MTKVLAVAALWQPDDDPALAGPAIEAAPEPELGAGTVPQPTVAAARHITSPAEMRSI